MPIRVLGAGPAGLSAAISLARAGERVQVHERRRDCGGRFRGDLQGLEHWSEPRDVLGELDALGIEVNFDCTPVFEMIETNGRRSEPLTFDRPIFHIVHRGTAPRSLDQGLKEQALALGVEIRFGSTLPAQDVDIVATGPRNDQLFAVDKGIAFETDHDDLVVGMLNDRAGPKGYSYLLVAAGRGCLCSVLFDRFAESSQALEEARRLLLRDFPIPMRAERSVGGVGHFTLQSRFRNGDALIVGEAAGIQDMLWGFGIRTALRSGHLAARCLLEGRDYAAEADSMFAGRRRASVVNRFLFELLSVPEYEPVLALLRSDAIDRLGWLYRFGYFHRLIFPLALVHARTRYPRLAL